MGSSRRACSFGGGGSAERRKWTVGVMAGDDRISLGYEGARSEGVTDVELFRAIFERSPIGAALFELDGTLVVVNDAMREMMGFPDPPLRTVVDAVFPEDLAVVAERFQQLARGEVN